MLGFNLNHISIKGPWYTGIVNACGKKLCKGTLWSLINCDAYDFKQLMKIWWAFKTDYLVAWSPGAFGNIGYPSETHLKRKSREISFAHNNRIKVQSFWSFVWGTEVSLPCSVIGRPRNKLRANEISRDLCLGCVSADIPHYTRTLGHGVKEMALSIRNSFTGNLHFLTFNEPE